MKVIYLNEENMIALEPSCVALGFFDGMHLGHQKLIDEVFFFWKDIFSFVEKELIISSNIVK